MYKVVLSFTCANESLEYDHSNESYLPAIYMAFFHPVDVAISVSLSVCQNLFSIIKYSLVKASAVQFGENM